MMTELALEEVLAALPPESLPIVEALMAAASRQGAALYLVGGPVRDLLLGREIRDVDLIVEPAAPRQGGRARPRSSQQAALRLARALDERNVKLTEYGRFGTVRIEGADSVVDLASARRESYEKPGALPSVEPAGLDEDLRRRDFSVNALAIPLEAASRHGTVRIIDVDNGLEDLADRKLRVLHRRSFHDDPTRVIRAARLAPRLGFSMSRATRNVLRDALRDGVFGGVSGDRLRREIQKCFGDATVGLDPAAALRLLADWHVLSALEPGLELPRESVAGLRRLGRFSAEPLWRGPRSRPWVAGLAIWLAPQVPALRRRTLRRFSVRGEVAERIAAFRERNEDRLVALGQTRGRGAVDALLVGVDEDELHALHAAAPPAVRRRLVRWAAEDRLRRAPLNGGDLVELGLSGPSVGSVLLRIRSAFLDGDVANREEAIALAGELARQETSAARGRRKGRKKTTPAPPPKAPRSAHPSRAGDTKKK